MKWHEIFDDFEVKVVTANDKNKGAYLPNARQREILAKAGLKPSPDTEHSIAVLNAKKEVVGASFYLSMRSKKADRDPEARMGREFISSWLKEGDRVVFGLIGMQLFVLKSKRSGIAQEVVRTRLLARANSTTLLKLALASVGKPKKKLVKQAVYIRNVYVVSAALTRAKNRCEMPKCMTTLFKMDTGKHYVEVHHIVPLAEDGDDTMANTAVLCAQCHRELHHGEMRMAKRASLSLYRAAHP